MDRILNRRERLRQRLKADDLDAILISSETNVSYLTGFSGDSSVLLVGRDRDVILSDSRYATQLEQECPQIKARIRDPSTTMNQAVVEAVGLLEIHRLGFEAVVLSVAEYELLRGSMPTVEMMATSDQVENLRQIKDEAEVATVRQAIEYAEKAFAMLRPELRGEATEKEVADMLEANLRRCGATGSSFQSIVAVGVRAALPHARPTATTRIGDDDFVLFDWGADGRPYKSDLTRVLVTGKVTPDFEKIYRTVLAAQERGIAAIRPGVKAQEVDAEARSVIEQAGFGRFFTHALGHGLGMDVHENPRLRKGSETILEPGMIMTVEPGIYIPDWGGVRIEDDVLVTAEGREVLTSLPKTLDWAVSGA